jgi:NAD(P)-dependent dehydrogenase (short-subunit alcohol dehydrogenase family)
MAKILITGSTDGLGREAARQLVDLGHEVVIHGRDNARTDEGLDAVRGAAGAVTGDLGSFAQTHELAKQANAIGRFDAIIHNAGVGYREEHRLETEDGLAHVFQINVLAPYLLTALVRPPARLTYLSSGIHRDGNPDLSDLQWKRRGWNGYQAYCDSKLFDTMLAAAVARRWRHVTTNSLEPGWVKTKMGGPDAPGEIPVGAESEVWLAVGTDPLALQSGQHFDGRRPIDKHPAAADIALQDRLLAECHRLTGVELGSAHSDS